MKKTKLMIVAAGLFATIGTISSCKKDNVKAPDAMPKNSTARTLSVPEINDLITEVNNFTPYAEAVALNPGAQAPGTLPAELADEDVVRYMENTFNFVYAQQEDKLVNTLRDEYTLTLTKTPNGKTAMNTLANSFVNAYAHVKQKYTEVPCADDEKILRVVDVEVANSTNSSVTLKISSVFHWKFDPTVPEPAAVTVPASAWADFHSFGGNNLAGTPLDPYSCVGGGGAPEVINRMLYANMGGYLAWYGTAPKVKFRTYLVSGITKVEFDAYTATSPAPYTGVTVFGGCDLPHSSAGSQNPWVVANWGTAYTGKAATISDYNSLTFFQADPMRDGFDRHLGSDILNYMLQWDEWILRNKEIALNKSIWTLDHTTYIPTTGLPTESYVMHTTYANVVDLTRIMSAPAVTTHSTGLLATF